MKPATWKRIRAIFEQAIELPVEERTAFVDASCDGEEGIRHEVELLLAEDVAVGTAFLEEPAQSPFDTTEPLSIPGTRVGARFELLRIIASGGMGTVYEATQDEPRRRVALKMMRKGLRSPDALRRFRFEAEVLGRLHHPGIAQVYASGTHKEGETAHPYFAMELVEGARDVLTYSREEKLSRRQRIEIFLEICEAVHHGHQRGVIHRDLKPGNVLVDQSGIPKIIDFGVARIADDDEPLSHVTLPGQILGTIQFMSPEQVGGRSAEVDTRSDVYALGCLLFELLAERPPFDLSKRSLPEAARIIELEEPKRPDELPVELGWICLKCLEKEPDRRYSSASELAADLHHYLNHEPVLAGPPSRAYALRKFVRRNRAFLTSLAAVVLALAFGLFRAEVHAREATQEANKAYEISRLFADSLTSVGPWAEGHEVRVVDVLEDAARSIEGRLADEPEAQAFMRRAIGESYRSLGHYREAEPYLSAALQYVEANPEADELLTIEVKTTWARYLDGSQQYAEAEAVCRELLPIAERELGPEHGEVLEIRSALATAVYSQQELTEAEELYLENLEILQRRGDRPEHLVDDMSRLGGVLREQGELEEARAVLQDAYDSSSEQFGEDAFRTFQVGQELGWLHFDLNEWSEAAARLEKGVAWCRANLDPEHPMLHGAIHNLASAYTEGGRAAESAPLLEEVVAAMDRIHGERSEAAQVARNGLAAALQESGRLEEAEELCLESLETCREIGIADDDPLRLRFLLNLGETLEDGGRWEEAEYLYREGHELAVARYGPGNKFSIEHLAQLIYNLEQQKRYEETIELADELLDHTQDEDYREWALETIDDCRRAQSADGQD